MDTWRENFVGVQSMHEPTNLLIFGAVDDVWQGSDGKLHVVDYKATSKDSEVTLDADWQIGYKRQMEFYQWLMRRNGFDVSDTGYFVYANGIRDAKAFDAKLEFDVKVIPYEGNDAWVEETIIAAKKCLDGPLPPPDKECEYCAYRRASLEETGALPRK